MRLKTYTLAILFMIASLSIAGSAKVVSKFCSQDSHDDRDRRNGNNETADAKIAENFFYMLRSKDAAGRVALENSENREYFAARDQITGTNPKFLVPSYKQALADPDPYIREQAGSLIVASAAYARSTLNQESIVTLAELGSLLVAHARETDVKIRHESISALQWLAPHVPAETFNLFSDVIDHETQSEIRKDAIVGIARFGTDLPKVTNILIKVAKDDPDAEVRSVANEILNDPNSRILAEPIFSEPEGKGRDRDTSTEKSRKSK